MTKKKLDIMLQLHSAKYMRIRFTHDRQEKKVSIFSFQIPKVHCSNCMLGIGFFSAVCQPGIFKDLKLHTQKALYRSVSTDVDFEAEGNCKVVHYCNILVDKYDKIVAIHTFTNQEIDVQIIKNLIGIHISFLGDIDKIESEGGDLIRLIQNGRLSALLCGNFMERMPNARLMLSKIKESFLSLRDAYASIGKNKMKLNLAKKGADWLLWEQVKF